MQESLSLYVHVPFCRSKCVYCDFNSYAGRETLIPSYVDALLTEANAWSTACRERRVDTVFFGGGTPSLLPLDEMARLMEGLSSGFDIAPDAEISLEANPESADAAHLQGLRRLGFNRLSLGVQSFDDDELRFLGRIHTAARAEEACHEARAAGFDNVNLDLVFGLPGQSPEGWQQTLERALALRPEHLSLYALTVEEGTPLAAMIERGEAPPPDDDAQAEMYVRSEQIMARAGYEHYEISNWALAGRRCRHNLTYWGNRWYVGLGAGAHSRVGGLRLANRRSPERYVRSLTDRAPAPSPSAPHRMPQIASFEEIGPATDIADTIILGLRLIDGVPLNEFSRRFGFDLTDRYAKEIAELQDLGLTELRDDRLRLTARGRLLASEVALRFLP
ncbi:MAG: radical SAM family heme chaperone HemW [Dehalococcoidia bacterium]|nr:radical SAM family heme chaperone HemW [Dehalococcoidia bacterium]